MNNKFVIILGGVIILCFIAFGAMFFMMWSKINEMNTKVNVSDDSMKEEQSAVKKIGPIYSMDTFIVNLDDPKLRKYLRLTLDLELIDKESVPIIEKRLPQIRDSILNILPSKGYEEITSSAGKNQLRAELLAAINAFYEKEVVTSVYFTEFVIQ